jgi:hypothetical protein
MAHHGSEDRTINDLSYAFLLYLDVLPTVPSYLYEQKKPIERDLDNTALTDQVSN